MDEDVGKILTALGNAGIKDDTVVIFASDNGYLLGEHSRTDKRVAYEESVRIPLMLRYPRLGTPGRVLNTPVSWAPICCPRCSTSRGSPSPPMFKERAGFRC